jgi:hypothetical protein
MIMNALQKKSKRRCQISTKISVIYVWFYCVNITFIYQIAVGGDSKCLLLLSFQIFPWLLLYLPFRPTKLRGWVVSSFLHIQGFQIGISVWGQKSFFIIFLDHSWWKLTQYLEIGHGRFLLRIFNFIFIMYIFKMYTYVKGKLDFLARFMVRKVKIWN